VNAQENHSGATWANTEISSQSASCSSQSTSSSSSHTRLRKRVAWPYKAIRVSCVSHSLFRSSLAQRESCRRDYELSGHQIWSAPHCVTAMTAGWAVCV